MCLRILRFHLIFGSVYSPRNYSESIDRNDHSQVFRGSYEISIGQRCHSGCRICVSERLARECTGCHERLSTILGDRRGIDERFRHMGRNGRGLQRQCMWNSIAERPVPSPSQCAESANCHDQSNLGG
jgi:hypothetical protein